jgi:hypothetical protein
MAIAGHLELFAGGQEDDRQRAAVEMAGRVVDLAESVPSIDLEKGLAIFVRGAQLRPLAHDDRDRGDGKTKQHQEDELDDETRLENQADQVEAHGVSPLAFLDCKIDGESDGDLDGGLDGDGSVAVDVEAAVAVDPPQSIRR